MGILHQTVNTAPITGFVNVKQHGVQSGGSFDNTSQLQARVTATANAAMAVLHAGTYSLAGTVTVPANGALWLLPGSTLTGAGGLAVAAGGLILDMRSGSFIVSGIPVTYGSGFSVTGGDANILATSTTASNFNTHINDGTSTGSVGIGNALAGAVSIRSGAALALQGSTIGMTGDTTITGNVGVGVAASAARNFVTGGTVHGAGAVGIKVSSVINADNDNDTLFGLHVSSTATLSPLTHLNVSGTGLHIGVTFTHGAGGTWGALNGLNVSPAYDLTGNGTPIRQITTGSFTADTGGASGYQILLGNVIGAVGAAIGQIVTGTLSGAGTSSVGLSLGANTSTATTNIGVDIGPISGAGTTNIGLRIGAISGSATNTAISIASGGITYLAATVTIPLAETAQALRLNTNGINFDILDTRSNVDNVTTRTFGGPNATIVSANGTTYRQTSLAGLTLTLTGGVLVTALPGVNLAVSNTVVTSASATTVTTASAVLISGINPAGSVTFTNSIGLDMATFGSAGGTTSSSIRIAMPTAATNLVGVNVTGTGMGVFVASSSIQVGGVINTTANQIFTASQGAATANLFIGNAQITVASDVRVKKNITPTVRDAMGILQKLNVVDFAWNMPEDPDRPGSMNSRGRYTGMLGQEMVKHIPWVVNAPDPTCPKCLAGKKCSEHPFTWHVEYEHLVPLLVKGIQQLAARIDAAPLVA